VRTPRQDFILAIRKANQGRIARQEPVINMADALLHFDIQEAFWETLRKHEAKEAVDE